MTTATILFAKDSSFDTQLAKKLAFESSMDGTITRNVERIINNVRDRGDEALQELTQQFDHHDDIAQLSSQAIEEASHACPKEVVAALQNAAQRIASYHQKQLPHDIDYVDNLGVRLGNVWRPMSSVGLYVPGGLASYPSSVLMNAIPAKVAGVEKLTMVVPAPNNVLNPAVLAAANIAGVDTIYKIGGAQAIAALAYGTQTIKKVDCIVGPGNIYVATAKRYVYGHVGIDMIAGPSEILVVSDNQSDPEWIAADLLSQAEHDQHAQSILITDDESWAKRVATSIQEKLEQLPRKHIAATSWSERGVIIVVDDLTNQAPSLINKIAPEHLELALDEEDANAMLREVQHAGAVFLGRYTPEAMGDYIAGPSHVLPTSSTARFSSGLSVYDFLKRMSVIGCSQKAFKTLASDTQILANHEGLDAHALSVSIRS